MRTHICDHAYVLTYKIHSQLEAEFAQEKVFMVPLLVLYTLAAFPKFIATHVKAVKCGSHARSHLPVTFEKLYTKTRLQFYMTIFSNESFSSCFLAFHTFCFCIFAEITAIP